MPDILIRNLDPDTVKRLKQRAKRHGRSLQIEIRRILEQAADSKTNEMAAVFARWKKKFAGRKFSSSLEMIRKDRRR
ncbi:MAG: hypothetical protein K8T25_04890 [Planctomycetia bacterium]|nr:hypothetical protein [Planctomycetia bacterium]